MQRLIYRFRRKFAELIEPMTHEQAAAYYPQQRSCQIKTLFHLYSRFLGERESGFFVEVGAFDGVFVSNTWGLAQRNWNGLLIEPVPELAELCRRNYANNDRITVIENAVGAAEAVSVTLNVAGTLTTANKDLYREYAGVDDMSRLLTGTEITVESRTLDSILIEHGVPKKFDVLVVDVEGYEREVFAGFSLRDWKPKMIIVELADTHPYLASVEANDARLGQSIGNDGYVIVYKDSVNTVFLEEGVWKSAFEQ